jgi:hypothetical protein
MCVLVTRLHHPGGLPCSRELGVSHGCGVYRGRGEGCNFPAAPGGPILQHGAMHPAHGQGHAGHVRFHCYCCCNQDLTWVLDGVLDFHRCHSTRSNCYQVDEDRQSVGANIPKRRICLSPGRPGRCCIACTLPSPSFQQSPSWIGTRAAFASWQVTKNRNSEMHVFGHQIRSKFVYLFQVWTLALVRCETCHLSSRKSNEQNWIFSGINRKEYLSVICKRKWAAQQCTV